MSGSFSEDEARRIFARAAERQHAVGARGEGLSLAELQAIGREAGLDPEHVAAAVAELQAGPAPEPVVVSGVDLTPRRIRVLPVELTDELWVEMVTRLRRTFGAKGGASEIGPLREWTSGPTSSLHVVAEPVEEGTRVTIETSRAAEASTPRAVGLAGVALAAFLFVIALAGGKLADPLMWVFVALFLMLGAVGAVASRRSLSQWSVRRSAEFDGLMDQFELLARAAPPRLAAAAEDPAAEDSVPAAPRLDLDALPELPPAPEAPARGPRTRA